MKELIQLLVEKQQLTGITKNNTLLINQVIILSESSEMLIKLKYQTIEKVKNWTKITNPMQLKIDRHLTRLYFYGISARLVKRIVPLSQKA